MSDDVYKNIRRPRGGVYIFNYVFVGSHHERTGAQVDSKNLKILFTRMGYKTKVYEDISKEETLSKLNEIQKDEELRNFDSFVCIILSHGYDDYSFCTPTGDMDLDEVRYHFTDSKCPQLRNKPKIFLINFCRGKIKEETSKLESDFIPSSDKYEAPQDMFTIYASIKNFKALRHTQEGTLFVQAVCKVFAENAWDTEINDLLKKLVNTMSDMGATTPEGQTYGFKKRFYFNPINIEEH